MQISLCLIALTYPQYRILLEQEARSKARLQRQREREGTAEKMEVDGEPDDKNEPEFKTEEKDVNVDIELEDMAQAALAEIELCLGIFSGGAAYSKYAQEYLVSSSKGLYGIMLNISTRLLAAGRRPS
jgi:hypothetical protein